MLYPIGFLSMVAGYGFLVRHVWHLPDRKAQIKRIFLTKKAEDWPRYPPLGPALIGLGALCGVVGSIGMLVCLMLLRR